MALGDRAHPNGRSNRDTTDASALNAIDGIICFTKGTAIRTPSGDRPIERLVAGDLVLTLDAGPQAIRWIGRKTLRASGAFAPVRFSKGTLGNYHDLLVSPFHRILLGGMQARAHADQTEVLAPARNLVNIYGADVAYGGMVTYIHLLFDQHQVVIANGAKAESFYPDDAALGFVEDQARANLFDAFPTLRTNLGAYGPERRPVIAAE